MFGFPAQFDNGLFNQFEQMRRQMDRLFGDWESPLSIRAVAGDSFPPVNIGASPKQIDVYVFAAGLDPASLDISMQENLLTVAGERRFDLPEGAQAYSRERYNGSFRRAISLPEDVDPDRVSAKYRDGVLHITVQRREEVQPRKIEVH